jgi:hypothetical protein
VLVRWLPSAWPGSTLASPRLFGFSRFFPSSQLCCSSVVSANSIYPRPPLPALAAEGSAALSAAASAESKFHEAESKSQLSQSLRASPASAGAGALDSSVRRGGGGGDDVFSGSDKGGGAVPRAGAGSGPKEVEALRAALEEARAMLASQGVDLEAARMESLERVQRTKQFQQVSCRGCLKRRGDRR